MKGNKKIHTEVIDIGEVVVCDLCNKDYTDDNKSKGGFLFGSKGVCPDCAPDFLERIKSYGEEDYIKGVCPAGKLFRDWILELRGGNNTIKITYF